MIGGYVEGVGWEKRWKKWGRSRRRRRRDRKEGEEDLKGPEVLVVQSGRGQRHMGKSERL